MIDHDSGISVRKQCRLLSLNRWHLYYQPKPESKQNLKILAEIDRIHLEFPAAGSRKIKKILLRNGFGKVSRSRVSRLMKLAGIDAIFTRKRTTIAGRKNGIYPYLLKGMTIDAPDMVWAADITYIPMARGFMYLFAIIDWYSRKIVGGELSSTLDTEFCVSTLRRAVRENGVAPQIINTDQGCQFTSEEWRAAVDELDIKPSMDGKGRWLDNVRIERFWRTLKYDHVYLYAFENGHELEKSIRWFMSQYNEKRPHDGLGIYTPEEVHAGRCDEVDKTLADAA